MYNCGTKEKAHRNTAGSLDGYIAWQQYPNADNSSPNSVVKSTTPQHQFGEPRNRLMESWMIRLGLVARDMRGTRGLEASEPRSILELKDSAALASPTRQDDGETTIRHLSIVADARRFQTAKRNSSVPLMPTSQWRDGLKRAIHLSCIAGGFWFAFSPSNIRRYG